MNFTKVGNDRENFSLDFLIMKQLDNCIDENHPKLYEDISAGEFLDERLIELGLIKK